MLNSKLIITGSCSEFYCNFSRHTHIPENHCLFMTYFQTFLLDRYDQKKLLKMFCFLRNYIWSTRVAPEVASIQE